jgi:hypothetical protein
MASQNDLRRALAGAAYRDRIVRLVDGNLLGAECLVASRQGLFAVNRTSFRPICYGIFFGLTVHDGVVYAFEACDRPRAPSQMGRIVRFDLKPDALNNARPLCEGLDNGCHQLAVIHGQLVLVDTSAQALRIFDLDGRWLDSIQPLAAAKNEEAPLHVHMNSICAVGGEVQVLLHNGPLCPAQTSEVLVLDRQWQVRDRYALDGYHCHDILPLEDGRILYCGSKDGELLGSDGLKLKLSDRMTRGLARTPTGLIVGTGDFMQRAVRLDAMGSIVFLDSSLNRECEVALPAAPTCIASLAFSARSP